MFNGGTALGPAGGLETIVGYSTLNELWGSQYLVSDGMNVDWELKATKQYLISAGQIAGLFILRNSRTSYYEYHYTADDKYLCKINESLLDRWASD